MPELEHPYSNLTGGEWLRGNLHAHTTASDGERSLQQVIDVYASLGHGFLMISNHDVYTSEDDYAAADSRGLVLIPGNEISANGPHLLHVGPGGRVEPHDNRQRVVDDVVSSGGFAVFNHPKWQAAFNHCPQELLESCQRYAGIEIYNGVISRLQGSPYATDRWDLLLNAGRRIWGFANDDSHRAVGDDNHGWNVAYARNRTPEELVECLRNGRFYASTGVEITRIFVDGMHIEIGAVNAHRMVALKDCGQRFSQVDGTSMSVDVPEDAGYVRFECWGTGEAFAWTQPFFVVP